MNQLYTQAWEVVKWFKFLWNSSLSDVLWKLATRARWFSQRQDVSNNLLFAKNSSRHIITEHLRRSELYHNTEMKKSHHIYLRGVYRLYCFAKHRSIGRIHAECACWIRGLNNSNNKNEKWQTSMKKHEIQSCRSERKGEMNTHKTGNEVNMT